MIRVMLVDDQTLVRQGVRSLLGLADDIEVVEVAADGQATIDLVPTTQPDVLLLDMRMPGKNELDVLRELGARNELPTTIILTTFDVDELVLEGLRAGARGYLLKDVTLEELLNAVRTVAEGKTLVRVGITERLMQGLGKMQTEFGRASCRERGSVRESEGTVQKECGHLSGAHRESIEHR